MDFSKEGYNQLGCKLVINRSTGFGVFDLDFI